MKLLSFVIAFSCIAFALADLTTGAVPSTTPEVATATTPKPNPDPPVNNYNVSVNGSVCLLATFAGQFVREDGNVTQKWMIDGSASVDETSACDRLVVVFDQGTFTMKFFHDENKYTFISQVTANLTNPAMQSSATNLTQAKVTEGSSYKCTNGIDISMTKNVTFKMTDVQLQPILVKDNTFGAALECVEDFSQNVLIPVIVGCTLGGLIVLVVIVYCIAQARSTPNYRGLSSDVIP